MLVAIFMQIGKVIDCFCIMKQNTCIDWNKLKTVSPFYEVAYLLVPSVPTSKQKWPRNKNQRKKPYKIPTQKKRKIWGQGRHMHARLECLWNMKSDLWSLRSSWGWRSVLIVVVAYHLLDEILPSCDQAWFPLQISKRFFFFKLF